MKFASYLKNSLTALSLFFVTTQAQAAKFQYNTTPTGRLLRLHILLQELVATSNTGFDLKAATHLVVSKKPTEKLENSIKQIHFAGHAPLTQTVTAQTLPHTSLAVYEGLRSVLAAGGLDKQGLQFAHPSQIQLLEQIFAAVELDIVNDPYTLTIAGTVTGLNGLDETYIAFVDQTTGEVLVFEAGTFGLL